MNITDDEKIIKDFIDNIFENFREPPLPLLKLRRENIGTYCNSNL